MVLQQGHTSNYIYIVLTGSLKVIDKKTGKTKSVLTNTNMFGYSALFSRYRHATSESKRKLAIEPYNIVTVGPCSLYIIRKTHAILSFPDETIESIRKICICKQIFHGTYDGVNNNRNNIKLYHQDKINEATVYRADYFLQKGYQTNKKKALPLNDYRHLPIYTSSELSNKVRKKLGMQAMQRGIAIAKKRNERNQLIQRKNEEEKEKERLLLLRRKDQEEKEAVDEKKKEMDNNNNSFIENMWKRVHPIEEEEEEEERNYEIMPPPQPPPRPSIVKIKNSSNYGNGKGKRVKRRKRPKEKFLFGGDYFLDRC